MAKETISREEVLNRGFPDVYLGRSGLYLNSENSADDAIYVPAEVMDEVFGSPSDGMNAFKSPINSMEEALRNGVFVGPSSIEHNPNGEILRCESIFELWRRSVNINPSDYNPSGVYYMPAYQWIRGFAPRMYTTFDLDGAFTYLELSYFYYYVLYKGTLLPWEEVETKGTTYIVDNRRGVRALSEDFCAYKGQYSIDEYIELLAKGEKLVPLPLYRAFLSLRAEGLVPEEVPEDGIISTVSRIVFNDLLVRIDNVAD